MVVNDLFPWLGEELVFFTLEVVSPVLGRWLEVGTGRLRREDLVLLPTPDMHDV